MRLGIDFGKVIMGPVKGGRADTAFLGGSFKDAMATPPSEGAFEVIERLVRASEGSSWIVSKCRPSVQNKTKAWLKHWDFYLKTGFWHENVRFCLERREKAMICRELGITHFIDDRLDVLEPMLGVVENLILFGEQPEGLEIPAGVKCARDWADVEAILFGSASVAGVPEE